MLDHLHVLKAFSMIKAIPAGTGNEYENRTERRGKRTRKMEAGDLEIKASIQKLLSLKTPNTFLFFNLLPLLKASL